VPVTNVEKDSKALTMTMTAEYDAPVERCWQLWADPRQLERWWGPPTYPATFVDHDLTPGSFVTYFMTGPEGDKPHAWWRVLAVDAPHSLEIEDGFGEEPGNAGGLPLTRMRVTLVARDGGGTRMTLESRFESLEAMEKLITMGMDEGMKLALGQVDAILAST
jgi:uncharacterized protein YndB with AHSA1/START domain